MLPRVPLFQTEGWSQSLAAGTDPYAANRCCHCHAPTRPNAARICLTRTDDGEWWVVAPGATVLDDERQLGDPHFTLPVGVKCLRDHPEFRLGLVANESPAREGC